jgi:hypothetical protein
MLFLVGDGGNDVCPAQRLRFHDTLFVREGYQLEEHIKSGMFRDIPIFINARIIYFKDGDEIAANMKIVIKKEKKHCFPHRNSHPHEM